MPPLPPHQPSLWIFIISVSTESFPFALSLENGVRRMTLWLYNTPTFFFFRQPSTQVFSELLNVVKMTVGWVYKGFDLICCRIGAPGTLFSWKTQNSYICTETELNHKNPQDRSMLHHELKWKDTVSVSYDGSAHKCRSKAMLVWANVVIMSWQSVKKKSLVTGFNRITCWNRDDHIFDNDYDDHGDHDFDNGYDY